MPLTVSEVERLAKAGVTVAFADIAAHVHPDPPKQDHLDPGARAVLDRWRRNPRNQPEYVGFEVIRFATHMYNDTVYVFVVTPGHEPVILTDDVHLFPSDALMAKIHLLEHQLK
jgi:hypothetical protein